MSLIQDQHDPSKQGMFSKAGRFTTEKYIIFQRKDEILHNKKRQLKIHTYVPPVQDPKLVAEQKKKDEKKEEGKLHKKEENQPFYKQISRDKRNQVLSNKTKSKPSYEPKYNQIDKSLHQIWDIQKVFHSKTQPRLKHYIPDTWDKFMEREQIPEKLQKPEHGLIEMGRTLPRYMNFMKNGNDPHPDRFNSLRLTQTWSNMRRTPNFSLDKIVGREDNKGYFSKEHQPDYNPNFEFGKKLVGKCKLNIAKQTQRKAMFKPSNTDNENYYDYDKFNKSTQLKSHVFQNIKSSPNFDKILPREIDANSPLPSFMQKHVNMRSTLTTLHHKMLEENYYSDGRFQSTASDFMKTQSQFRKSKQQDEDDDDEESFDDQQNQ